jgi:hypothetical protein
MLSIQSALKWMCCISIFHIHENEMREDGKKNLKSNFPYPQDNASNVLQLHRTLKSNSSWVCLFVRFAVVQASCIIFSFCVQEQNFSYYVSPSCRRKNLAHKHPVVFLLSAFFRSNRMEASPFWLVEHLWKLFYTNYCGSLSKTSIGAVKVRFIEV